MTLRGTADGIFQLRGKGYAIVDYKTAKYTPGQEGLLPVYETQLNAYAYIGNRVGFAPISQLALIYMEPVTNDIAASDVLTTNNEGFALRFSATIVPVGVQPDVTIPPLLQRARRIYDLASPPDPQPSCKDCQAVTSLIRTMS
ncbi:MAG: PD-(D/E)XK nuclease family protein [Chloroflexi bacterium]|nr:PD-(D/E)XK nuclease family protein [Chloroflexota bacterium]